VCIIIEHLSRQIPVHLAVCCTLQLWQCTERTVHFSTSRGQHLIYTFCACSVLPPVAWCLIFVADVHLMMSHNLTDLWGDLNDIVHWICGNNKYVTKHQGQLHVNNINFNRVSSVYSYEAFDESFTHKYDIKQTWNAEFQFLKYLTFPHVIAQEWWGIFHEKRFIGM